MTLEDDGVLGDDGIFIPNYKREVIFSGKNMLEKLKKENAELQKISDSWGEDSKRMHGKWLRCKQREDKLIAENKALKQGVRELAETTESFMNEHGCQCCDTISEYQPPLVKPCKTEDLLQSEIVQLIMQEGNHD